MKDMDTENIMDKKRVSPMKIALVSLIAIIGLALVQTTALPYPLKMRNIVMDEEDKTKVAIMDWMRENSTMPEEVLSKIYHAAAETGNRDLILAICLVESNFDPQAKSHKGAIGLMGIMPGVWLEELKSQGIVSEREDLYKISSNIAAGAHVLATYLSETNDLRKALIKYVGGASAYAAKVFQAKKSIELAQSSNGDISSTGRN